MPHLHTNNLINETSPYLLQHAHNPVDWHPWGDDALQKAKESGKPILVSIGYSACHWCHVMERESFEDETTAEIMNSNFINIKIDREERPDLDHIYMDAVQAMSGSGGWPLNVFLTTDAKPFYGGTYFPPVKAFNRSSWQEVLLGIAQAWKERRDEIESQAENLVQYLQKANSFGQISKPENIDAQENVPKELCHTIFQEIMKMADKEWGGFGNAPKFPQTFVIQYLLQYYYFTGNNEALHQVILSLNKMLQGGIYDQVGGGLARYSTDKEWLAPHFEKMLYDNALLINVLCDAYQITRDKNYENAIRKTIAFIQIELMSQNGGFTAGLDADSEGEEGKYYVWQKEEINAILGEDATIFCKYFDVTGEGNWEGKNILRVLVPLEEFVKENNLDKSLFSQSIENSITKLYSYRNKRVKPQLDDKIILSWNALMLNALCKAAAALQDNNYKEMVQSHFKFMLTSFKKDEGSYELLHTFKNGIAKNPAFLDDYAYFIEAIISLYVMTFNSEYLNTARKYCLYVLENFSDDSSPFFFYTHQRQKDILVRKKEIYDGPIPSGNAIMADNLLKLSIIFDKIEWRKRAGSMLETIQPLIKKYPASFSTWSVIFMQQAIGINEIVISGSRYENIANDILFNFIPNKIIITSFGNNSDDFPVLQGKPSGTSTLLYLCKGFTCFEPYKTAQNLLLKLFQINKI